MTKQSTPLWAFMTADPAEPGVESVAAVELGLGTIPLLTTQPDDLPQMRQLAERLTRNSGATVRLMYFASAEELEVFKPA